MADRDPLFLRRNVLPDRDELARLAGEEPLVWERPRIVSTRTDTAAGTPRPNGWEA